MAKRIKRKGQTTSTYTTHKTEDRVTETPLKIGDELICSRRLSSSCSTSDTCCVNLVTHLVISNEWGKDTTSGIFLWPLLIQMLHSGQPSHGCNRKSDDLGKMNLWFSRFLVSSSPLSRKSWEESQVLEYHDNNRVIFTEIIILI